jgi:hypothetical protein
MLSLTFEFFAHTNGGYLAVCIETRKTMHLPNLRPEDLPVIAARSNGTETGLIQNLLPHLNPDEREFLISGLTPEDWDAMIL